MDMSLRSVVGARYGLTGKFSVIHDVLNRARQGGNEGFYRNANGSISLLFLLASIWFTITRDAHGNIIAAEAVGTDNVKRSFARTSSFVKNQAGLFVAITRQEFFENGLRYLYITTSLFQGSRKISVSMTGGGKSFGFSINFPGDGSRSQTNITIASGVIFQDNTMSVTKGVMNLDQGSLASPSFTADLSIPPEIQQQMQKVVYFSPLFMHEDAHYTPIGISTLQAVGMNKNMTPNEAFKRLASVQNVGVAATALDSFSGSEAACITGGAMLGVALDKAADSSIPDPRVKLGVRIVLAGAVALASYICTKLFDGAPGPIQDGGIMPPDASVPLDGGGDMSDVSGGAEDCVPPDVEDKVRMRVINPRVDDGGGGNCM